MSKAFFVETAAGIFILDGDGNLVKGKAFKGAGEAEEELASLGEGKLGKLSTLAIKECGKFEYVFEDPRLAADARERLGVEATSEAPSKPAMKLRSEIGRYVGEIGLSKEEYDEVRRKVSINLASKKVSEASSALDVSIVQAVNLLDETDKCVNLLVSRLREWYGLHFPELWGAVQRNDRYLALVSRLCDRSRFTPENLKEAGVPERQVGQLSKLARESSGAPLETSLPQIKALADTIVLLGKRGEETAKFLEEAMELEAPNLKALVGASIGARLVAQAGGLLNLAKMPSSKIQVLGAEKALFRSMKTGSKPPKHGTIFQHAAVHGSPRKLRGKVARALAGKIAIAARIDAFSGEFQGDRIGGEFERRVEQLLKEAGK
ncbi:MAG: C/D box methylation guide ribonucleoprotein complex aNOP56 subunit [Candidatus Brockarchaeota archaeon]|nr:C/D box methylation guide ribonucleoprotein complex aNOP56 subunit [Candidatus Brockarchaeota archaeon]